MAWKNFAGVDLHREYPADGTRPGSGTPCLLVTMTHASRRKPWNQILNSARRKRSSKSMGPFFDRLTLLHHFVNVPEQPCARSNSRRHTVWRITGARPRIQPNYSAFRRLKSSNSARKDSASSLTALEKRKYGSRKAIFFSGFASDGNLQSMGLSPTPS
jgi:hypothetical protein